jgi:hypothetical protein
MIPGRRAALHFSPISPNSLDVWQGWKEITEEMAVNSETLDQIARHLPGGFRSFIDGLVQRFLNLFCDLVL